MPEKFIIFGHCLHKITTMKPKIGDKVRVIRNEDNGFKIGQIVEVVELGHREGWITCEGSHRFIFGDLESNIKQVLDQNEYTLIEE